jgi:hypothetical protein
VAAGVCTTSFSEQYLQKGIAEDLPLEVADRHLPPGPASPDCQHIGPASAWNSALAGNESFCWAKLNHRMYLSTPSPKMRTWFIATAQYTNTLLSLLCAAHEILRSFASRWQFYRIVKIFQFSSFTQTQSKCLLLYLWIKVARSRMRLQNRDLFIFHLFSRRCFSENQRTAKQLAALSSEVLHQVIFGLNNIWAY